MSTPNDPQNPYGGEQPQDPYGGEHAQDPYGAHQPNTGAEHGGQAPYEKPQGSPYPAAPQYPGAPEYAGGQPYPAAPQYGAYAQPAPPNYLVWAILTTVLCCLPLGIAAIVFSSQVNSKWMAGDFAGAQEASRKARLFSIWSAVAGGAILLIWAIIFIALGIHGANTRNTY